MDVVVLISADTEWWSVRRLFPEKDLMASPYGEIFLHSLTIQRVERKVLFMHGGWGKIAAGASAQYAIDRWQPKLLVNLGTCGGFMGEIQRGEIILAEKTLVYDIYEQMGDPGSHVDYYRSDLDLSWLEEPLPHKVHRALLVSGDRDLVPGEIGGLKHDFGAIAGDWESASIAFVANRNQVPALILRGVSDLVSEEGGEAYGNEDLFAAAANEIMSRLVKDLPDWLAATNFFS